MSNSRAMLRAAVWVVVTAACFHLAYALRHPGLFILLYLLGLAQLAQQASWRMSFYSGLVAGLLIGSCRLSFFWTVFGGGAVALWLVFAFWIGLFVALARLCLLRLSGGWRWAMIAATLELGAPGQLPADRWLAPAAFLVTLLVSLSIITTARPSSPPNGQAESARLEPTIHPAAK